ncbi:hypothetical protein HPB49_025554 [Dermacentor silvarum]|uniref:Uncharacterized protein n=1 Tax=Dermacentor silvarum TaxID=543639 RepID=A0ACB8E471_DERSI|nr:hypothetical protein HPB49_025554 [Dermacentor silvarum]
MQRRGVLRPDYAEISELKDDFEFARKKDVEQQGRPSKLCEETNLDWAPTLLLGYKANNEGTARYERAARRWFKRTTPEVDAVTTAPARAFGVGATPPENRYDRRRVESVGVPCARQDAVLLRSTLQVFEQTTDAGHIVPRDTKRSGTASEMAQGHFRDDWTPNTTSCYSTVCSRHFGSSDFKEGCKIRKLKKDAVPSIFEEYPAYLQPPKNRERSDASVRKREAAAPVNTPPPKRRAVESQLESPSLPLNDLPSVDVASQELSLVDCSATELPLPLENGASERCITTTVSSLRQVSSLFSVSAMDKRKWRRKERDLNAPIERLKNTVDKYKQKLQKLKEECYVSAFLQVVEKAKELAASILVEQVQNFAKKKPTWSEVTVRHAVV